MHAVMAMRAAQVLCGVFPARCSHDARAQLVARGQWFGDEQERVQLQQPASDALPLIFCGDFNVQPFSFQYACITSGKHALDPSSPHLKDHRKSLVHGWRAPSLEPMKSLYSAVHGSEPAYTNSCIQRAFHGERLENAFCGTLDYIFANARVCGKSAPVLPDDGPHMPNQDEPSDHLPVVVDVDFS